MKLFTRKNILLVLLIVILTIVGIRLAVGKGLIALKLPLASVFSRPAVLGEAEYRPVSALKLISSAVTDGQTLPEKYTCEGAGINPPLTISGVSDKTKSLVLILEDPDAPAGPLTHWLLWNISSSAKEIREDGGFYGAMIGRNSFGAAGYGAPCPPPGKNYQYIFRLLSLDKRLVLSNTADLAILNQNMENHILADTTLTATFSR